MSSHSAASLAPPLTISEAAERLGLHRLTLRAAIDRGEVPAVQIGRRWLVPVAAVERLASGQPAEGKQ